MARSIFDKRYERVWFVELFYDFLYNLYVGFLVAS